MAVKHTYWEDALQPFLGQKVRLVGVEIVGMIGDLKTSFFQVRGQGTRDKGTQGSTLFKGDQSVLEIW